MRNKIALIIDETGCDQGEAQLALEASGYEVKEAVKTILSRLRRLVVLKAKFACPEAERYGLVLAVIDLKPASPLRLRAVVSCNPAVYEDRREGNWFEFEKYIYRCRLLEGSLQAESLDLERHCADYFSKASPQALRRLSELKEEDVSRQVLAFLGRWFKTTASLFKLEKDMIDLGQFRSLKSNEPLFSERNGRQTARARRWDEEPLILDVAIEKNQRGIPAAHLRAGDLVSVRITDDRDIAVYLAKIFGGYCEKEPAPVLAPVEAIEACAPERLLIRVRFSSGTYGDAFEPRSERLKAVRIAVRNQEKHSWWRRLIGQ